MTITATSPYMISIGMPAPGHGGGVIAAVTVIVAAVLVAAMWAASPVQLALTVHVPSASGAYASSYVPLAPDVTVLVVVVASGFV